MAFPTTIVVSPGFAGGRLRVFNLILCAVQASRVGGADRDRIQPSLILDENLLTAADLRLPVQNAHGDVVSLEVPDHGKLGHNSHAAFCNALLDTAPPTAEVAQAIEDLMPAPLQSPLEAARDFWPRLFPQLEVEIILRGAPSPAPTRETTGITWCSARHFHFIKELGFTSEWLFQGEAACLRRLVPIPAGELGEATEVLRGAMEQHLSLVRALAEDVDPSLVGAWVRLRRNLRESLNDFASRADRCGRNRGGIRRAHLHALAQAVRPHGKPQESGLSLFSAVASYQLDIQHPSTYTTSVSACSWTERLLRTT